MLQKGTSPCVANPAEKVTACCSAIPTSKERSGIASIIILSEEPEGIAGVIPMIFSFFSANSKLYFQKILGIFEVEADLEQFLKFYLFPYLKLQAHANAFGFLPSNNLILSLFLLFHVKF